MRIGVVGYGCVGKAMCRFLECLHEVLVFDKYLPGLSYSEKSVSINICDLAFVGVPTPFDPEASKVHRATCQRYRGLSTGSRFQCASGQTKFKFIAAEVALKGIEFTIYTSSRCGSVSRR